MKPRRLLGRDIPRALIFRDVQRLTSFTEDIRAAGMRPGGRVLAMRETTDARVCRLLKRPRLLYLKRLRLADGRPICIENTYLPLDVRPLLEGADLGRQSLYRLLQRRGESLSWSKELMEGRVPTAEEARLMRILRRVPVVSIARLAFDRRGRPCEFTENVLRADRYLFYFELRR